jgi:hypothetical protein
VPATVPAVLSRQPHAGNYPPACTRGARTAYGLAKLRLAPKRFSPNTNTIHSCEGGTVMTWHMNMIADNYDSVP